MSQIQNKQQEQRRNLLERYLASQDFAEAVIQATRAGFSGSHYQVEIFPDGTHRLLSSEQISNPYESAGALYLIPTLDTDDYREIMIMARGDDLQSLTNALLECQSTLEELANTVREADQFQLQRAALQQAGTPTKEGSE